MHPVDLRLGDERIENLRGLLEQFVSAYRVFDLELKNFSAFAPKVIYVDVISNSTLEALKNHLEDALLKEHYPVKKEERKFHPHVTIANRDLKKEDFPKAWDYFKGIRFSKQFPVQAISLLKHNGQRWITLLHAALP